MNTQIFYSTATVCAISGLFILWKLGFQRLYLDEFRDATFLIRDELYELAQTERISPNSPAYRAVETLLNGLIQYAHRFSVTYLLLSSFELRRRRTSGDEPDSTQKVIQAIEAVKDEEVRKKLMTMTSRVSILLASYVAKSSLAFIIGSLAAKLANPVLTAAKRRAIRTFENEALKTYEVDRYANAALAA